ncbi:MAG: hypothetical protein HUJ31_16815 [Pseudomonadales bacterium]|nr:hypothetical protein [Pseudomonadales bacterium]
MAVPLAGRHYRALIWAVALVFFLGQVLLMGHTLAHPLAQADNGCEVCLVGTGGAAVAVADQPALNSAPPALAGERLPGLRPNNLFYWSASPRAPPA